MTPIQSLARSVTLATAAVCALAVGITALSPAAVAKKKAASQAQPAGEASPAAQKEQAAEAARKAYDSGLKEFANGRNQGAIDQLSAALKSGALSGTQMAKSLYTRGLAYKKLKQPGLAISDLTSALWLKNGLSENERSAATAERAQAYEMAGIQDSGKGPERVVGVATSVTPGAGPTASSAGLSAAAIAQAASSGTNSTADAAASGTVTRQDATSEAARDAANARAAYAPVNTGLQSVAASTVVSSGATPKAAPASAPSTPSGGSSSVAGFFSSLFGGGSSSAAPPPEPVGVTTASTGPLADVSSWSDATVVSKGNSAAGKKARASVAAASSSTRRTTKGKYKLHIAALRSRADAEALAQKIVAQHGGELSNHVPTVDEAVIGSMGTFYRVRIGGYISQDEPRGLCDKLRTSGLDCLVVTN